MLKLDQVIKGAKSLNVEKTTHTSPYTDTDVFIFEYITDGGELITAYTDLETLQVLDLQITNEEAEVALRYVDSTFYEEVLIPHSHKNKYDVDVAWEGDTHYYTYDDIAVETAIWLLNMVK